MEREGMLEIVRKWRQTLCGIGTTSACGSKLNVEVEIDKRTTGGGEQQK